MTSQAKSRQEREKKVGDLVAFATTLSHRLRASPSDLTDLKPVLASHLCSTFPLFATAAALHTKRETLDGLGTDIWNLATQLGRDDDDDGAAALDKRTLCSTRLFAVLLLHAAAPRGKDGGAGGKWGEEVEKGVRVLKVALKAAKGALEAKMVGDTGVMRVLECAAEWEERLRRVEEEEGRAGNVGVDVDVVEVVRRLRAEYWILRTVHGWKQSRLDIAEHMYSHGDLEPSRLAPDTANMLTDALYEIGRDVFGKHQYEDAAKWLERAFGVIGERNLEELDHDVVELRISIMNYLLRAYLGIGDQESLEKARGIVSVLELENGDKMVVQLLKLEVLTADGDSEIDVGQYSSVVSRMIRTVVLTDASFKTIMHHVHKIKGKSSEMAGKILEKFIQTRILTQENAQWIEKVVVTQLWISLESVESATNQPCEKTLDLLNLVLQNSRPFNAPATHAAQTLLWKRIEIMYGQGKYDETEAWCSVSLHPLFEKAGDLNKAKIARKLILCAVAKQDHNAARKVFFEMSESARNAPMTRYLMYKSALRDAQPDFAAECLDVICRQSDKDVTLLYACVIEAQSLSDRRQSILALQKVLEMYDYGAPPEVNLPALLRSTIRLLVQHLGGVETFNEDAMGELCKVFEAAAAQATKAMRPQNGRASSEQTFTVQELEWFSRNSYNISLKYCAATHPSCLIRLLDKCIQFIALLQGASPRAEGGDGNGDLVLRLLLCHYLASCAATVLARSTDSIEESLTAYMTASTHVKAFRTISAPLLRTSLSSNNGGKSAGTSSNTDLGAATLVDLAAKRAQLLRYELESALKRRDWDGLDALWDDCFDNQGIGTTDTGRSKERASSWYTRHLEALADLALVIHAELSKADTVINKNTSSSSTHFHHADTMTDTFTHRARILGVLQRIANTSWQGGTGYTNADVVRLARWIRCLFQLCIDSSVSGSSGRQPNSHDADAIPLQCVEQATTVVSSVGIADRAPHLGQRALTVDDEDGGVTSRENAYPLIEAEWLAATAFNRGIEFFCAGDDQRCRSWCDRALGLAQAVEKGRRACGRGRGGGLYGTLMGKYRGLFWGGEDE